MDDSEAILQAVKLMQAADVMVAVYDPEDRLRLANDAFCQAWHIAAREQPLWSELMRRNFHARRGTVINTPDFENWLLSTQARRGKSGFRAFETDLHDGRWLWMTETTDARGWMLCAATDITAIRTDERSLRQDRDAALRAAQTDELTGIPGRRFVMSKLEEILRVCGERKEVAACLAVLDIDNFKYINDRFGHVVGDAILKNFANTVHQLVRKTDVFGRVGGRNSSCCFPARCRKKRKRL